MTANQIDHDRLFKELLETFFVEFMELFFPEAAPAIDLMHIKFLQQEIFTDVTIGEKRKVDILVETRLKGEPGLILIHVEPQAYEQKKFNERMFIYFSRLYEKYRRKVLPIAVFSYDRVRDEPDRFELGFSFLEVLNFQFYKLELKKLNWREYIHTDNPVAAALLSKMGFKPEERVKVKLEFMRMLVRMRLDPARMELLTGFFETYLNLNSEEKEQYNRELGKLDSEEAGVIMQITTSWHAEGRAEGRVERTGEIICKYLARKFGEKSAGLQQKVVQITELEKLDDILEELFAANNIEEARAIINNGTSR
ncbi:MAG: Rpn family recombination-promoting nuclease/putative transposase [Desulfotomaculaceae bacterium]|nr:Rpn family recombination-promoting nuclease/putative transposase [Desulfotomaculaceae bacterium]